MSLKADLNEKNWTKKKIERKKISNWKKILIEKKNFNRKGIEKKFWRTKIEKKLIKIENFFHFFNQFFN